MDDITHLMRKDISVMLENYMNENNLSGRDLENLRRQQEFLHKHAKFYTCEDVSDILLNYGSLSEGTVIPDYIEGARFRFSYFRVGSRKDHSMFNITGSSKRNLVNCSINDVFVDDVIPIASDSYNALQFAIRDRNGARIPCIYWHNDIEDLREAAEDVLLSSPVDNFNVCFYAMNPDFRYRDGAIEHVRGKLLYVYDISRSGGDDGELDVPKPVVEPGLVLSF